MNELVVRMDYEKPSVSFNFEELKEKAEAIAADYTSRVITEDTYKAAKADAKELGGFVSDIEKARKAAKAELKAPIDELDAKCKEIEAVLKDAKALIESKTVEYDDKIRNKKREAAQKAIDEVVIKFGLTPKYASQLIVKPEYLYLTATLKSAKEDIENQAVSLKVIQTEEARLLTEGQAIIDTFNEQLTALKMSLDDFKEELRIALEDSTGDKGWFASQIRADGNRRLTDEAKIREKAEEEARRKMEEEARKEEPKKAEPIVPEEDKELAGLPIEEPEWEMSVMLFGKSSALKELGKYLAYKCEELGCEYKVDTKNCKRRDAA